MHEKQSSRKNSPGLSDPEQQLVPKFRTACESCLADQILGPKNESVRPKPADFCLTRLLSDTLQKGMLPHRGPVPSWKFVVPIKQMVGDLRWSSRISPGRLFGE